MIQISLFVNTDLGGTYDVYMCQMFTLYRSCFIQCTPSSHVAIVSKQFAFIKERQTKTQNLKEYECLRIKKWTDWRNITTNAGHLILSNSFATKKIYVDPTSYLQTNGVVLNLSFHTGLFPSTTFCSFFFFSKIFLFLSYVLIFPKIILAQNSL